MRTEGKLSESDMDVAASKAFIARTRTMSDREMLEYFADAMQCAAMSRPQRRNNKKGE
jgi:hypothetical protein